MTDIEEALKSSPSGDPAPALEAFARRAEKERLVDVAYTSVTTPVGELLLAATPRGVVQLSYDGAVPDASLEHLARRVSPRVVRSPARLDEARRQLDDYFEGRRRFFDLPLDWSLVAGFGRRVLEATAEVPYGNVTTYSDVAAQAGSPRGARAAGNALGANPIAIVVPCHRVLHKSGGLGGYGGGLDRKEYLLRLEGVI